MDMHDTNPFANKGLDRGPASHDVYDICVLGRISGYFTCFFYRIFFETTFSGFCEGLSLTLPISEDFKLLNIFYTGFIIFLFCFHRLAFSTVHMFYLNARLE